jgi:L-ascorbate metabolism protein UlaG (beta-lactamase superfamily)
MPSTLTVRLVGGPTAVLDYAGVRLLTDPTFDPPASRRAA